MNTWKTGGQHQVESFKSQRKYLKCAPPEDWPKKTNDPKRNRTDSIDRPRKEEGGRVRDSNLKPQLGLEGLCAHQKTAR